MINNEIMRCDCDQPLPHSVALTRPNSPEPSMKSNRSIPTAIVIPVKIYPDVREAVAWLSAAFGFAERVRIAENHRAQLRFGDGAVIVGDVRHDRRAPRPDQVTHSVMVRVGSVMI